MSARSKDHFSGHASIYAKYRPNYPPALFEYLSSLVPVHQLAWDCATGNGQAALALAPYFEQVIATDFSEQQLQNAIAHPNIIYKVAPAEDSGIATASVDLMTVAQAIHWFNFEKFYLEVRRVLKKGGILAFWTYAGVPQVSPEVTSILKTYYFDIVGSHWPPERKYVDEQYRTIPLPLEELTSPSFPMEMLWSLEELLGYLESWSPTQRFIQQHGVDPRQQILEPLKNAWGDPEEKKIVRWQFYLRIGKI